MQPFLFSTIPPLDRLDGLRPSDNDLAEYTNARPQLALVECEGRVLMAGPAPALMQGDILAHLKPKARNVCVLGEIQAGEFRDQILLALDLPVEAADELLGQNASQQDSSKHWRWQGLRNAAPLMEPDWASLAAFSRSLLGFHRKSRFCTDCGHPTAVVAGGLYRRCQNARCGTSIYPRIDPAVLIMITDQDKILLHRQAHWAKGQYSILAGFCELGEGLEATVRREAFEEAGIEIDNITYVASQPWPFQSQIMMGFKARAITTSLSPDPKEIEDLQWFSRDQIKDLFQDENRDSDQGYCLPIRGALSRSMIESFLKG